MLNAAYPLPRHEDAVAFAARVRALGGDGRGTGLRVELTGPWAPYSFADTPDGVTGVNG